MRKKVSHLLRVMSRHLGLKLVLAVECMLPLKVAESSLGITNNKNMSNKRA